MFTQMARFTFVGGSRASKIMRFLCYFVVLKCSICSFVFVAIVVIWFCFWVGPRLSPGSRVLSILLESDSCGWPQQSRKLSIMNCVKIPVHSHGSTWD